MKSASTGPISDFIRDLRRSKITGVDFFSSHLHFLRHDSKKIHSDTFDLTFMPLDLVVQLKAALDANNADLAVAKTGDQPHPVFSLCRTSVLPSLTAFLESGGRKIDAWYAQLKVVEVQFADEAVFRNINTREELAANSGN